MLVAVIISAASYSWVENPIRHLKVPAGKSVAAGVTLVVATVVILSLAIAANSGATRYLRVVPAANEQAVLRQVAAAPAIQEVPTSIKHWDD